MADSDWNIVPTVLRKRQTKPGQARTQQVSFGQHNTFIYCIIVLKGYNLISLNIDFVAYKFKLIVSFCFIPVNLRWTIYI